MKHQIFVSIHDSLHGKTICIVADREKLCTDAVYHAELYDLIARAAADIFNGLAEEGGIGHVVDKLFTFETPLQTPPRNN